MKLLILLSITPLLLLGATHPVTISNQFQFATPTHALIVKLKDGEVRIRFADGAVEYIGNATADEAASVFWNAIGRQRCEP